MIYENYGMRFIRLQREHLELIRYWRNHPSITQFMEDNEPITYEAQLEWFEKVNTNDNLFFVAEYANQCIGLISGKGFDEKKTVGEGGIFIWEQSILNSLVPVKLSMALIELSFIYCNFDHAFASILKTNKRAIQFNKMLGYKIEPNQENNLNQLYKLTKESYLYKRKILIRSIKYLENVPKLIFSDSDKKSGYMQYFISNFINNSITDNYPKLTIEEQ